MTAEVAEHISVKTCYSDCIKAWGCSLPDIGSITVISVRQLSFIGMARAISHDHYEILISYPYIVAVIRLYPYLVGELSNSVIKHELAHVSQAYRGEYVGHDRRFIQLMSMAGIDSLVIAPDPMLVKSNYNILPNGVVIMDDSVFKLSEEIWKKGKKNVSGSEEEILSEILDG